MVDGFDEREPVQVLLPGAHDGRASGGLRAVQRIRPSFDEAQLGELVEGAVHLVDEAGSGHRADHVAGSCQPPCSASSKPTVFEPSL